jgi:hypothetical protein
VVIRSLRVLLCISRSPQRVLSYLSQVCPQWLRAPKSDKRTPKSDQRKNKDNLIFQEIDSVGRIRLFPKRRASEAMSGLGGTFNSSSENNIVKQNSPRLSYTGTESVKTHKAGVIKSNQKGREDNEKGFQRWQRIQNRRSRYGLKLGCGGRFSLATAGCKPKISTTDSNWNPFGGEFQ